MGGFAVIPRSTRHSQDLYPFSCCTQHRSVLRALQCKDKARDSELDKSREPKQAVRLLCSAITCSRLGTAAAPTCLKQWSVYQHQLKSIDTANIKHPGKPSSAF